MVLCRVLLVDGFMSEDDPRSKEAIMFPGVREPLPKYWGGLEAIYYCDICQSVPPNGDPNRIVVSTHHDGCIEARTKIVENEIANILLMDDPGAKI